MCETFVNLNGTFALVKNKYFVSLFGRYVISAEGAHFHDPNFDPVSEFLLPNYWSKLQENPHVFCWVNNKLERIKQSEPHLTEFFINSKAVPNPSFSDLYNKFGLASLFNFAGQAVEALDRN